ncbi:MAG: TRAP transporter substrate-binding protein DctP [Magnetococcales bacterium]|nr:TRAP transporter substrate-binding protein DctP [Magnetococcales bacterium]
MHHPKPLIAFLIWILSACIAPLHAEPATPPPDAGETIPMRLAAIHKGDVVYVQALSQFAKTLEESSGKKIRPELLTNGKKGAEETALQELFAGNLEGGFFSPITLARQVAPFRALVTPRLFTRPEQVRGLTGSALDTALREAAKGKNLLVLGYGSYGFYGVLNFRAAASGTPTWNGLPTRVPNDPWMIEVHQALGLQPSSMPASDLTEAISTGWVQGIAATPEMLNRTAFANANAKAFHQTRHLHGWMVLVVNLEWFNKLPQTLQEGITHAAASVLPRVMEQAFSQEKKILDKWSAEYHVATPTPTDPELATEPLKALSQKTIQASETHLNQPGVVAQAASFNQGPPAPAKRESSGKKEGDPAKNKKAASPKNTTQPSGSEPASKATPKP